VVTGLLLSSYPAAVSPQFLPTTHQLPGRLHYGEHRLLGRVLITGQQRVGVYPPSGCLHVLDRQMLRFEAGVPAAVAGDGYPGLSLKSALRGRRLVVAIRSVGRSPRGRTRIAHQAY
jgi:hypothetical protein